MLFRPALVEDVPAMLLMVSAICDLHETNDAERFEILPDVLDRYAAWLPARAVDPRSVFLLAERDDGTFAGFIVGTVEAEVPIFRIAEFGWIHDVWVELDARRQGVARELATRTIAAFKAMGVQQIRLHTAAFNDDARAFFSSIGFRASVVEMLMTVERPNGSG